MSLLYYKPARTSHGFKICTIMLFATFQSISESPGVRLTPCENSFLRMDVVAVISQNLPDVFRRSRDPAQFMCYIDEIL